MFVKVISSCMLSYMYYDRSGDNIIDGGLEEELPNSMKKGLSRLYHHVYLAICTMIDLELPNSDDKDNIIDGGLEEELPKKVCQGYIMCT